MFPVPAVSNVFCVNVATELSESIVPAVGKVNIVVAVVVNVVTNAPTVVKFPANVNVVGALATIFKPLYVFPANIEGNLASAIVPDDILLPFNAINDAPLPENRVADNVPVDGTYVSVVDTFAPTLATIADDDNAG